MSRKIATVSRKLFTAARVLFQDPGSLGSLVARNLQPSKKLVSGFTRAFIPQDNAISPPVLSSDPHYTAWILEHEGVACDRGAQASKGGASISVIVAVDASSIPLLEATTASLVRQAYTNWELLVVPVGPWRTAQLTASPASPPLKEDARIRHLGPANRRGEALRAAVEQATGDFIMVLEAGDVLPERALSVLASRLSEDRLIDILYADEDIIENGLRRSPQLKPSWSPELLRSYNYFGRPTLVRRAAVVAAGSFAGDLGLAAEWDLYLRLAEPLLDRVSTRQVQREPQVLCHLYSGSCTGRVPNNVQEEGSFREALRRHWRRQGLEANVTVQADGTFHAAWPIKNPPLVSIIIPNKNRANLLRVCLQGLREKTSYPRIEVIVVDNGSTESDVLELYNEATADGVRVVNFNAPFNYSRACNLGAAAARGELLLFLNNDIEVIDRDWLSELVRYAQLPGVGVVGTKLVYPDGVLQHAGVVVGMHVCGLVYHRGEEYEWGPFGSPSVARNWLGVMGACQMVRRDVFNRVGGFDEAYAIAMSDIKLTLDAWRAGYRTAIAPRAKLVHHEGASRGKTNPADDIERTIRDIWALGFEEDPYFHPGLSAIPPVPTLRVSPEPSTKQSLKLDTARLVGEASPQDKCELHDDHAVAEAAGQPRSAIFWDPDPAGQITDWAGGARFMIDLLRRRPDIRARFPFALSDGAEGPFVEWLRHEALDRFGFSEEAISCIVRAFAEDLSGKARQAVLLDGTSLASEPLLFLPQGRDRLINRLFRAVSAGVITREAAWWLLLESEERPQFGIIWSWKHNPEWQSMFPSGITRFGREAFADWIKSNFQADATWPDASQWPDVLEPADQIRVAYEAEEAWRKRVPNVTSDRRQARQFLAFLTSEDSDLKGPVLDWLRTLDIEAIADKLVRRGVNILGHFTYPSGLRTSAQSIAEGLRVAGYDLRIRNVPVGLTTDEPVNARCDDLELFSTSIVHVQPEPFFLKVRERSGLSENREQPYQIGYWYWEFDTIPPSWDAAAARCDELWTATNFIAKGLQERYRKPVHVFLPGVELPAFEIHPRSYFGLPDDVFIFLFTFHMTSIMERKNPLGLIEAFKLAFSKGDRALLVLKTSFGDRHPAEMAKLASACEGANVLIIDEIYTKDETLSLMQAADAYVSLHRSEGLGLTMAEAMLLGRPTIATRYSGNLDFMDDTNSLLVDCSLEVLKKNHPPYDAGLSWARPATDHAARLMRTLYQDRDFGRALGLRAQADLRHRLRYSEAGRLMAGRLEEIARQRTRGAALQEQRRRIGG